MIKLRFKKRLLQLISTYQTPPPKERISQTVVGLMMVMLPLVLQTVTDRLVCRARPNIQPQT